MSTNNLDFCEEIREILSGMHLSCVAIHNSDYKFLLICLCIQEVLVERQRA